MSESAAPVPGEIWINDSDGSAWDVTTVNEETQSLRIRPSGVMRSHEITMDLLPFTTLYSLKGKEKPKRAELKRGDIVRLRSGGPLLTVIAPAYSANEKLQDKLKGYVDVLYFTEFGEEQHLTKVSIPADLLDLVVFEEPK